MTSNELTLRKIALVLVGLEPTDADRLLAQFPPALAEQVRCAVETLGDVSRDEQESAIMEFLESQARAERDGAIRPTSLETPQHDSAAVELDADLARQFAAARGDELPAGASPNPRTPAPPPLGRTALEAAAARPSNSSTQSSWNQVRSLSAAELGKCLVRENAQTIAAVLASLPTPLAAQTLASLPEVKQPEVLRRLTHARPLALDLLDDIAAGLLASLAPPPVAAGRSETRESAVTAIMAAADVDQRRRWRHFVPELPRVELPRAEPPRSETSGPRMLPFAASNPAAAAPSELRDPAPRDPAPRDAAPCGKKPQPEPERVPRRPVKLRRTLETARTPAQPVHSELFASMSDLLELPETDLVLLVASSDPWAVALALAGAAPEVAEQWMRRMPSLDAREIQSQLTRLGPWRLADAEEAEQQLLATARRLFPNGPDRASNSLTT